MVRIIEHPPDRIGAAGVPLRLRELTSALGALDPSASDIHRLPAQWLPASALRIRAAVFERALGEVTPERLDAGLFRTVDRRADVDRFRVEERGCPALPKTLIGLPAWPLACTQRSTSSMMTIPHGREVSEAIEAAPTSVKLPPLNLSRRAAHRIRFWESSTSSVSLSRRDGMRATEGCNRSVAKLVVNSSSERRSVCSSGSWPHCGTPG